MALIAIAAGIGAVVGQSSDSPSRTERRPHAAQRPKLVPYAKNPLSVKGTGFRPHERVRVAVKGVDAPETLTTGASAKGVFFVGFRHVSGCDSVTVTASGSKGSRALFNFSQIACIEP